MPANSWGIVGERGPEIVRGPANVTGRQETAQMMGGPSLRIGQMVFPSVTDAKEARKSAAEAGREINRVIAGAARFN